MQTRTEISGVLSAGGILDRIVEAKFARLESAKSQAPLHSIAERARAAKDLGHSLTKALKRLDRVNIIAEIKKQSPSKGIIREDFDPRWIAESYERAGAAALSVLCEEDFFGGSLSHLSIIRGRVDLPLVRKDFIFDEYQLFEAVLAGADAILLIVAILDNKLLSKLIGLAKEIGLDALVEVHSEDEMERAVDAGASTIGINNRDLTTFVVDLEVSYRLARLAPKGTLLVSESGINSIESINQLQAAGFNGFLVGEHLMRAKDPGEALKDLMQNPDL
jgi:indole-3-glycerol phosphate synthase